MREVNWWIFERNVHAGLDAEEVQVIENLLDAWAHFPEIFGCHPSVRWGRATPSMPRGQLPARLRALEAASVSALHRQAG